MKKTEDKRKFGDNTKPLNRESILRQKTVCLSRLVDGFLENSFDFETLRNNPDQIQEIKNLLQRNFWGRNFFDFDPNWYFDSELYDIDNPELHTVEEVKKADNELGAKVIIHFHELLKTGFWDEFKGKIRDVKRNKPLPQPKANHSEPAGKESPSVTEPDEQELLQQFINSGYGFGYEDSLATFSFLKIEMPQTVEIAYSFEDEKVTFFKNSLMAIHYLTKLVNGLSLEAFGECKDDQCGRWFIRTSKRKRDFCNRRCAARYKQREIRQNNREAFNAYHREYYLDSLKTT